MENAMQYIWVVPTLHQIGTHLAVGAALFALIFFAHREIFGASGVHFDRALRCTRRVLAVGIGFVVLALVATAIVYSQMGSSMLVLVAQNPLLGLEIAAVIVAIVSEVLLFMRYSPTWLGPALTFGALMTIIFSQTLPIDPTTTLGRLFAYAVLFIAVVYALYSFAVTFLKRRFEDAVPAAPEETVVAMSETVVATDDGKVIRDTETITVEEKR